jgi:hypothetical protein
MQFDIGIWIGALLTLGIISFLYKDNIIYKISEAIFVGVSAGFWFIALFWDNLYRVFWIGVFPAANTNAKPQYILFGGVILGMLMLSRLLGNKVGWISRWPLAFIVGATAGLKLITYLASNALSQINATVGNFVGAVNQPTFAGLVAASTIAIGTFCGLVYFFFSKEHRGWFGGLATIGTWFLMVTFGASFGYTVMSRMSLLLGRIDFLLSDWLHLIK